MLFTAIFLLLLANFATLTHATTRSPQTSNRNATRSGKVKTLLLLAYGGEDMEIFITADVLTKTKEFDVTVAGVTGPEMVITGADVRCIPDQSLDSAMQKGPYDLIVLPGGLYGAPVLVASDKVGGFVRQHVARGGVVAAICGGNWALMKYGVFKGKRITSFPYFRMLMRQFDVRKEWKIVDEDRVLVDGKLISSQGPATTAEFSFAIVEYFLGKPHAELLANFFLFKNDLFSLS
ncbi:Hypothetical predicted protein [Cloeon dipterum]|uniref:DJ-1/PfpI domain-containing protein n=5 Tax=Cloeon TaxID=197151 RepID=A0A8S1D390_9INSE|nr:Hypothetical predicted protein [Cloeon dipterum]